MIGNYGFPVTLTQSGPLVDQGGRS
jgi:hypothetical protein